MALFFVKNNESRQINTVPWWREGAMIFSEISAWIVVPIVLALVAGKKLDSNYGTEPWIFLGLALFGFLVTAYGIIKSVSKYSKRIKKEEEMTNKKV